MNREQTQTKVERSNGEKVAAPVQSIVHPYFEQDGVAIYHGDCRDIVPHLPHFGAIVTDPPYAIPTAIAVGRNVARNLGDLGIVEAGLGVFFDAINRRLNGDGRWMIFCDQNSYHVMYRLFYGRPMALLVWSKGRIGMGREFRKSFELVLHAWQAETPTFSDGKGRADVLTVPPVGDERIHPAEKPVPLLRQLLEVCSGPILDPFMGSGSTLIAARDLGLRAVGIEINEEYCEKAANRLRQGVLPFVG